jgi:hypothetical protein
MERGQKGRLSAPVTDFAAEPDAGEVILAAVQRLTDGQEASVCRSSGRQSFTTTTRSPQSLRMSSSSEVKIVTRSG